MNNEKKSTVIGVITAALGIAAFVAFAALVLSIVLFFRSCTRVEPNTGKEPYTTDYIEGYLETCYDRDFTFVSEFKDETVEYDTVYLYRFRDSDGVEFNVAQHYNHGYMFNGHYEARDSYYSEKLLSDKAFMDKLEGSGIRYTLDDPLREDQVRIISVVVKSDTEAETAAAFFYDLAQSDPRFLKRPQQFYNFYSQSPSVYIRSLNGSIISTQQLILYDSGTDDTETKRKEFIDKTVSAYRREMQVTAPAGTAG